MLIIRSTLQQNLYINYEAVTNGRRPESLLYVKIVSNNRVKSQEIPGEPWDEPWVIHRAMPKGI